MTTPSTPGDTNRDADDATYSPITDFGLAEENRALWGVSNHDSQQIALARQDEPHAVQVSHQSDGWLVLLYDESGSAPVPIAYRPGVATEAVQATVRELIDEAESLRPPEVGAYG